MFMFQHKKIGNRLWTRKTDNMSLISRQICISQEGCSSTGNIKKIGNRLWTRKTDNVSYIKTNLYITGGV